MNWDQEKWMGVIRHVLTGIGPLAAYLGYVDEATWATVSGAIMTFVGFVWSWRAKA